MPPRLPPHSPFSLTEYQRSLLVALQKAGARFLVIGAVGMAAHGHTRDTQDIDLWIAPSAANAPKVLQALADRFRSRPEHLTEEFLVSPNKRLALPSEREKEIDILTSIGALSFDLSAERGKHFKLEGLEVAALGIEEMLYSKILSSTSEGPPAMQERETNDFLALLEKIQPSA